MGVRLFVRGADSNGHVANYVETEQIVEVGLPKSLEAIFFVPGPGKSSFPDRKNSVNLSMYRNLEEKNLQLRLNGRQELKLLKEI